MNKALKNAAEEFLYTKERIRILESTLKYQKNIKRFKTIPKKYTPTFTLKLAENNDTALQLQQAFDSEYKTLFYQHLDKVISENTIALEIKKAKILSQNQHFEKLLKEESTSTGKTTTAIFQDFFTQYQQTAFANEILTLNPEKETPSPDTPLQTSSPPSLSTKSPKKRKHPDQTPNNVNKQPKLQPFLESGIEQHSPT